MITEYTYTLHILLLQIYHQHRHLHSFPTRRSSDLNACRKQQEDGFLSSANSRWKKAGASSEVRRGSRSEEHTSELQSRENLVCRLLLEKKNTIYKSITV